MQSIGIAAAPKFSNQPSGFSGSSPAKNTRSTNSANASAAAKISTAGVSADNKASAGPSRVSAVHLASSDNEGAAAGGNWDDELDDLIGDD